MSKIPSEPVFWYEDKDDGAGPTFWWHNPWSGEREKIASLFWPAHPIEETAAVERLFESLKLRSEALESQCGSNVPS